LNMNLNHDVVEFFNRRVDFETENITAILGDAATRHWQGLIPKAYFSVPAFTVPDTGSIPVEFTGTAYQTVLDAADEFEASYL